MISPVQPRLTPAKQSCPPNLTTQLRPLNEGIAVYGGHNTTLHVEPPDNEF
ncbi:hypothetical protein APHCRT_0739 [Anaplasma phagocytophilum str. CRT53-1]|uniref:Uncharacterized protein n=1 Tax=Anaplasma phagocytophilum str. CRT53-1 TaxID=1359157 RepID=A0A0F3Q3U6_ANAPH|nr:hypothetical protein APHCRT_0739 [Anaplasma phagocytophilum str. CRT53-1]KJV98729.1 hypothetical protein OTSANNIE_0877 [Anaplasma phagocytophilum str. Annie]